jgi:hypothetical protein
MRFYTRQEILWIKATNAACLAVGLLAGLLLTVNLAHTQAIAQQEDPMFNCFSVSVYIDGIITADHVAYFDVPCNCSLIGVSAAANTADTGGTIDIGTKADPDGYLDGKDLGDQDGAYYDLDDFNGALVSNQGDDYPHIDKGTTLSVKVIDAETSPTGTHVVLYFTPG